MPKRYEIIPDDRLVQLWHASWNAQKRDTQPPYQHAIDFGRAVLEEAGRPIALSSLCEEFGWRTDGDSDILIDRITDHIRALKADVAGRDSLLPQHKEDAARWQQVLQHVGTDRGPSGPVFVFRSLYPIPRTNPMHGSTAQHFTDAIDDARTRKLQQSPVKRCECGQTIEWCQANSCPELPLPPRPA